MIGGLSALIKGGMETRKVAIILIEHVVRNVQSTNKISVRDEDSDTKLCQAKPQASPQLVAIESELDEGPGCVRTAARML